MARSQIRITCPDGVGHHTTVELDGVELSRSLTGVTFKVSANGLARVTLEMFADVEIVGEAAVVKRWREAHARRLARAV